MRGMHPERKGMTRVMNCGRTATIETYRNSCDMDIRYEDGTLKTGVRYDKFLKGEVKYPVKRTYPSYKSDKVNLYLHEKRVMNNGIMAEVITFRHRNDIDVRFANGVIKEHLSYENFYSGRITDGNINRLGETRIMKNGLKATIVRYIAAAVGIFFKSTANAQPSAAVISISEKIMMLKKMVICTKKKVED